MRLLLIVEPSILEKHIFKPIAWIHKLNTCVSELGMKMFTFYSMRYAHAEEMNVGNVETAIIRKIMGHTDTSTVNEDYAENRQKRVTVLGEILPIGIDIMKQVTDEAIIPLEFKLVTGGILYDPSFLESIEDSKVRMEFEQVTDLVTKFIETGDLNAKQTLFDLVATPFPDQNAKHRIRQAKHKAMLTYLTHIPLGTHFTFPNAMFPPNVRDEFNAVKSKLEEVFKTVTLPENTLVPEVWSFPQVVFGNWRQSPTKQIASIIINPKENAILPKKPTEDRIPKRPRSPKQTEEDRIPKRPRSPKEPEEIEWDIIPSEIEKGDIVVILCSKVDKSSFTLPNIPEKTVWIAKAVKYYPATKKFTGIFMYNKTHNPKDTWVSSKKQESLYIEDYDIMEIFSPTNDDGSPINSFDDESMTLIEKSVHAIMELTKKTSL